MSKLWNHPGFLSICLVCASNYIKKYKRKSPDKWGRILEDSNSVFIVFPFSLLNFVLVAVLVWLKFWSQINISKIFGSFQAFSYYKHFSHKKHHIWQELFDIFGFEKVHFLLFRAASNENGKRNNGRKRKRERCGEVLFDIVVRVCVSSEFKTMF